MADEDGAHVHIQCSDNEINLNCVNCVLLNGKLCEAIQELESARSIILLLQEDIKRVTTTEASTTESCPRCGFKRQ